LHIPYLIGYNDFFIAWGVQIFFLYNKSYIKKEPFQARKGRKKID